MARITVEDCLENLDNRFQLVLVAAKRSRQDELERRLRARGQDPDTIIERRMQAAVREMTYYAECDYLIINDDFERALDDLAAVISANHLRIQPQSRRLESLLQHLLYAANT